MDRQSVALTPLTGRHVGGLGLGALERDDVFEFALHATVIAKGFPFGVMCRAVVDVWRYHSRVVLTDRPVAGLAVSNRVVAKLSPNITAFSTVRAQVATKMPDRLAVLVVDPVAGHYSGPL